MHDHISGKAILITGGTSGFGLAAARLLLARGARVAVTGRDPGRLASAASTLGPGVLPVQADATASADWDRTVGMVLGRFGAIDVLVNNHGAGVRIAPVEDQSDAEIDAALAINLASVLRGCRTVLPHMRRRGSGHIVNVASVCAYHAWAGWGPYTAAKAGLAAFTRVLHLEMQPWGGKATSFVPAAARTGFAAAAGLDGSGQEGFPDAGDFAAEMVKAIDVPPQVFVEETVVWGTRQVITPF